jgi:hypothetical protein
MKFLVGVMLAISLGCASFGSQVDPPLAIASEVSMSMEFRTVMVIVRDNNLSMYCAPPDAANDIKCEVGYGFLEKHLLTDWEFLSSPEATQICAEGMFSAGPVNYADVRACGLALLRIRFTQLVPEDMGKDY